MSEAHSLDDFYEIVEDDYNRAKNRARQATHRSRQGAEAVTDLEEAKRAARAELASLWELNFNAAPFTAETLIAASLTRPALRTALHRLAPHDAEAISSNRLVRELKRHATQQLPWAPAIFLRLIAPNVWSFARAE